MKPTLRSAEPPTASPQVTPTKGSPDHGPKLATWYPLTDGPTPFEPLAPRAETRSLTNDSGD